MDFQILRLKDLSEKVVPFFKSMPLQSVKNLDYKDFCKTIEIMNIKGHLRIAQTLASELGCYAEGLNKIRKLKAGMNKSRNTN